MRREPGQLPSQPIANLKNNPPTIHQPPGSNHQFNVPPKNPQFENANTISELRSERIIKDPYHDQMRETSTDTSQNKNIEEEVSTKTNHIEESESKTSIEAYSNLSKKDKGKKRADELSELYKPKVPFSSSLKVGSSHKK